MYTRFKVISSKTSEEFVTIVAQALNSQERIVAEIVCELNTTDGTTVVIAEESKLLNSLYDEIEDFVEFQGKESLQTGIPANLKLKFVK